MTAMCNTLQKHCMIIAFFVLLVACESVSTPSPPPASRHDSSLQVEVFSGTNIDAVLNSVEKVLRHYQPGAELVREANRLHLKYDRFIFFGLGYDKIVEEWVVTADRLDDQVVASVAMETAGGGGIVLFITKGHYEFHYPNDYLDIDYAVFWQRVHDHLENRDFAKCKKPKREARPRYFEPICDRLTVEREEVSK